MLGRLANTRDPLRDVARNAVDELRRRNVELCITAQVLVEHWAVATRPIAVNGFGLTPAEAAMKTAIFEASFRLLEDRPDVYSTWRSLVTSFGVQGKQVHDARLVAVCHVHLVPAVLTFNVAHFLRFASASPGLQVIDPATL